MIIQFLGMAHTQEFSADLPANTTFSTTTYLTPAYAGVAINGTSFDAINDSSQPNYSSRATWLTGPGTTSDFEVRCTVVSGSIDAFVNSVASSATGVWLSTSSIRRWGIEQGGNGSKSAVVTLSIRSVVTGQTLDTATYTLTATANY